MSAIPLQPASRLPRWARLGFRGKIVALLTLSLLSTLAATLLVVNLAVEAAVADRLDRELDVGERVWVSFYESRTDSLLDSVGVLARDFGFKAAAAIGEEPTARSALRNQADRIQASLALLLDTDGRVVAASTAGSRRGQAEALSALRGRAERDGRATGVVRHNGHAYLVAMVPVDAPTRIGWVVMGRELDAAFANQFRALTELHLVLQVQRPDGSRAVAASSIPGPAVAGVLASAGVDARRGPSYLARSAPMPAGHQGMQALLLAPRDDVLAPFRRLQRQIVGLAAAAALLALVVATLIARGVSRPVAQLGRAARRIEAGRYGDPLPPLGDDELGQLGAAFNRMQIGIAEREQQILYQASHDGLTGLPNRSRALAGLQRVLDYDASARGAVLMLDLDRFKQINDTLGHGFGDEVLIQVAQRLRAALRPDDLLARLGGDEFLVVLDDLDAAEAVSRAQALADTLRVPLRLSSSQVSLDVSVGVALYPEHGESGDVLMRRADIAMYEAKDLHSGVAVYQAGRDEQHLRQLTLLADLRRAFSENELSMVFQPQIDVATGQVVHAEALIRWTHPLLGQVRPDEFVPLAERSGLIHELTRFVLDQSFQQQRAWVAQGLDLAVAVNVSAIDLLDRKFPDRVLQALASHGVAVTPDHRDHRDHPDARPEGDGRGAQTAARSRYPPVDRRFRHRAFLPGTAARAAGGRDQDRQELRDRPHRRQRRRGDREVGDRDRSQHGVTGHRRGGGDAGKPGTAPGLPLRSGPGVPVLQAAGERAIRGLVSGARRRADGPCRLIESPAYLRNHNRRSPGLAGPEGGRKLPPLPVGARLSHTFCCSGARMRRRIVAGNWKLHGDRRFATELLDEVLAVAAPDEVERLVFPPLPYLVWLIERYGGRGLGFGAQDVSHNEKGAYTGEVSAAMLVDVGARYALVGHSERRQYHGESSELVARKFFAAKRAGLIPVLCIGETLSHREDGQTEWRLEQQLAPLLEQGGAAAFDGAVVAYEPVWAIGTGKTASPEQVQAVHAFIRGEIAAHDARIAGSLPLLYGGSVKADNAGSLFSQPDVDGGLIGGASLVAADFNAIAAAAVP